MIVDEVQGLIYTSTGVLFIINAASDCPTRKLQNSDKNNYNAYLPNTTPRLTGSFRAGRIAKPSMRNDVVQVLEVYYDE